MANSYENTIMPEKPVEEIKPDAIPVDDKGQPLPDPTENLSNYIAPKGVEELRKAYSEVEVDEDVRNTMEPPQKTGLLRKHRAGKRGYDYYGTPAGSVPNDSNGLKPSPLSELFSEAEALEPDFDLDKIKEHVLNQNPEDDSRYKVVETPKLDSSAIKNTGSADKKSDDDLLKKPEVVKDPNAPKFLDMYKESTNTRVIYQSDSQEGESSQLSKTAEEAQKLFAEHSQVTKAKKRISRREEKKAIKAAIKAEKKAAKERRKAEKAARKAAKKAARKGTPAITEAEVTAPEEIIRLREEKAEEEKMQNTVAAQAEKAADKKEEAVSAAEEKTPSEDTAAENTEAEVAEPKNAEAAEQLEELNRQKEEAELEAQRAAQEAEKRLQKEKEALKKQRKETKAAQEEKIQALIKLDAEKAAARKAAREAKSAREEAERLKAELEAMKEAAAQALAQKEEAEEAAKIAREEKEKLDAEMRSRTEKEKPAQKEKTADEQQEKVQKSQEASKTEKLQKTDVKEAGDKDISVEDKPIIKSVMEKHMNEKIAAEKNNSADAPAAEQIDKKVKKNKSGDIYMNSPTMEVIKRRIAEMEAQLSSNDNK